MTPLFQTAVRGGFSTTNMISPYHETLKGFFALPIWDWSLLFKPQLWGFWLLPPAYAYSLYFAMLWASFLAGYTILLRQLGAPLWTAALGSLALFFSHYVQVWWTSGAPTFAFAPWPLIVLLLPIRPLWKLPLLFWTSALWVFSYVYPPFLITAPFAMAILLLAFRRDALSWAHTLVGGVALAALGAAFYLYFGDLIEIMQATVYPGQRISVGGGVPWPKLLAHLLPFFNTLRFAPLLPGSNDCEIAVVSTLLPLAGISFVRYRSIIPYVRTNFLALGIVIVGLAMMLAWMWLPIPPRAGQFLLWTKVPPHRMLWAFGLLFTLAVVLIASKLQFELSRERFLLFSLSLIAAWLVSKIGLTDGGDITVRQALGRTWWFDLFPILPFGVAAVVCLRSRFGDQGTVRAIFAAAAVSGAATFGSFNPLQPAFPIFNLPQTPFLATKREEAKRNPNGWLVLPGGYGALFSGAGIPAINHTLTTPQLEFFRKFFPNMPADQFNQVFNRYAHIIPQLGGKPYSPQADVIVVPVEPFNELPDWKFTDDASLAAAANAAGFQPSADIVGFVDSISRIDPTKVRAEGWAADLSSDGAPMALMVFVNGHGVAYSHTDGARPDVTASIKAIPKANPDASKNTTYASSFSCAVGDKFFVVAITKDKRYAPLIPHPHICP